ncbi:hypothetical protein K456DRAFT_1715523 [Colletotrichum gloeosporioides 23]|nr:hypothetical protein K456DRAFT_1715523 [Colletotrichum gloeosporioides 23]
MRWSHLGNMHSTAGCGRTTVAEVLSGALEGIVRAVSRDEDAWLKLKPRLGQIYSASNWITSIGMGFGIYWAQIRCDLGMGSQEALGDALGEAQSQVKLSSHQHQAQAFGSLKVF